MKIMYMKLIFICESSIFYRVIASGCFFVKKIMSFCIISACKHIFGVFWGFLNRTIFPGVHFATPGRYFPILTTC